MKLSLLVAVFLRLFAIYWLVACIVGMMGALGIAGLYSGTGATGGLQFALQFARPVAYGVLATLAWLFAGGISRRVTGATDPELALSEIGPGNLYTLGILGMGLYFALTHLGGTINWLHYLAANDAGDDLIQGVGGLSLYDVTSVLIPFAAGVALSILSPKIGRRLASFGGVSPAESSDEDLLPESSVTEDLEHRSRSQRLR